MNGYRIRIICIGKLKEKHYKDAADEYLKRLKSYAQTEIIELKDEPAPKDLSPAELEKTKELEARRIQKYLSAGDYTVSLCIEGKGLSSPEFSRELQRHGENKRVCFIIGGSNGLAKSITDKSDFLLSLSPMTFPHQLARVLLLEQIYRAFKIGNNEAYHK